MKDVRHSISALFVLIVLVLASCIEGATVLVPWGETVTDLSPTDGTALVTVRPTLRWKAVDGAIKYYVQLALDDEDLESTPMTEVLEAAYSPSENLMDGVVYRWRVRAVNATNQLGPWSVVSSLSVGKNWLSKETALGVIRNTTDGSVKYQIEISDNREALDGFVQEEDSPIDKKTYYAIFKDADGEDAPWSAVYMLSVGWSEDISGLGITDDAVASLSLQIEYSQLGGVNYLGMLSASRAELESMASDRAILSNMPSGAIGTSFYWHVREVKEDELAGSWSKVNTLVLDDILEAVSGLSPANGSATTDTTPALSWSETSGAASYQIRMADSESGLENAVPVEEEGEIHHPTTAWDNSDVHYWQVRAKDANGQYGPWSAIHSLEVTWGAIDELSPAAGSSTTDTTPALSWNAVSGAAGYEVQIAGSEAGLASAQSVEVSAASYTPSTALTNNQTHYWRVRAKDGDGQHGAWSAVQNLTVNIGAVSGLSPADGATTTDTTPALSWNAVSGAAGYEVQIADSEAGLASAQSVEVSGTSYTPTTALTNNTTHHWRVRAVDGDGQYGTWSAIQSLAVNIGAVSGLSPSDGITTTDTTPALSWNAVEGAAGYEVQIADSEAGVANAQAVEAGGTSYTPTSALTNNQTHYWRVRAKDGDGQYGTWSAVQSLAVNIGAVSGLSPSSTTDTTPALRWNAVPGAAGYEVQIADSEGGVANSVAIDVTDASYTPATALTNLQTHYWRVRAKDGDGQYGTWSAEHSLNVVDDGSVYVEGGSFQMGSTAGYSDEEPVHQVTVSTFYMSRYEVTHGQYLEFLNGAGVSAAGRLNGNEVIDMDDSDVAFSHDGTLFSFSGSGVADSIDCPVMEVTWYGAAEYANWLSAESGLTKVYTINGASVTANWSANGYRLPTEAEWEYAARGGNASKGYFYAGSDNAGEVGWYSSNSGRSTHPVGGKAPNELGLYDMSGNVYEWCWDWKGSYSSGSQSNPRGPASGSGRGRRGGSWVNSARNLRSASRSSFGPGDSDNGLGFRLVRREF